MKQLKGLFLVVLLIGCSRLQGQTAEEWNGAFPSWANVKLRFQAKGDGLQDDTPALQAALDSLSNTVTKYNLGKTGYTVVYLPAGTYRITRTLVLKGRIGVNIIGEDPATTIIKWDGRDSATMLLLNASASVKIARISWNGQNKKAGEGIGIHWRDKWKTATSQSFASLDHEIADCIFTGLAVGIGGGLNWNDSEITINRCTFNKMTTAAINITGFNALDYWIWNCKFIRCIVGINNVHGNYHVYNSYFSNCNYDLNNNGGNYTSMRGCFSDNSGTLSKDEGSSFNPFKRVFQNNIVKNIYNAPIYYLHVGKPTFFDNQFGRNRGDTIGKNIDIKKSPVNDFMLPVIINYGSWFQTTLSILSIGNSYYYSSPFRQSAKMPHKNYVANDQYGKQVTASGEAFANSLQPTPQYTRRKIFEVPVGAGTEAIQSVINQAAKSGEAKPVVHFPFGTYIITKTLVIPAGSDLQLIGDGMIYSSTIQPQNPSTFQGSCLVAVKGPSFIAIRDIQLGGNGVANKNLNALQFDNIDQRQSFVQLDQLYSLCDTSVFMNRLDYTRVEKNNSFFSNGNIVVGGDLQKQGKGTMAMYCFGGQFAKSNVLNNGKLVAKDCWWEGATRIPLSFEGDGDITIDGAMVAPDHADSATTIKIGKFNGKISLMNMYIQGGIDIQPGNEQLKLFCWDNNFFFKKNVSAMIPPNFKGQLGFAGLTAQCFDNKDPDCKTLLTFADKFVNVSDEMGFVTAMVQSDRDAKPGSFKPAPGASSVYISRITINAFKVGMQFSK